MTMEREIKMNIYVKLSKARVELQNSEIKKSGYNSFSKYKYFELQDFLPTINEIFNNLGLVAIFNLDEKRAKLTIVNADKTEESLTFYTPTAEADIKGAQAIQKLGGVHTYLKRYLYLNALEIAEHDAIDGLPQEKNDKRTDLTNFINKNNLDIKVIAAKFNLNKDSKDSDYNKALEELSKLDKTELIDYIKAG